MRMKFFGIVLSLTVLCQFLTPGMCIVNFSPYWFTMFSFQIITQYYSNKITCRWQSFFNENQLLNKRTKYNFLMRKMLVLNDWLSQNMLASLPLPIYMCNVRIFFDGFSLSFSIRRIISEEYFVIQLGKSCKYLRNVIWKYVWKYLAFIFDYPECWVLLNLL